MTRLGLALLLLLWAVVPSQAATFSVLYAGASWTQFVLTYAAPDANACTIEVSESSTYSPLVHDVNPSLFSGANLDNRPGSITLGTSRTVVVGERAVATAADAKRYSRALQANTTHYWRVVCAGQVRTGTAKTMNVPNGHSRSDMVRGDATGAAVWPTLPTDRTTTIIDPWTGVRLRSVALSGDAAGATTIGTTSGGMHTLCSNNLSAQGFYRCALATGGGNARALYAIKPTTGEVRFLGLLEFYGQTFGFDSGVKFCETTGGGSWLWDQTDPNVYYCQLNDSSGNAVLARVTLGGGTATDTAAAQNSDVTVSSVTNLTVAPNHLTAKLAAYNAAFDPTKFNCLLNAVQLQYGVISCLRGEQDSIAWVFAINVSTGAVIAGMKQWEQSHSRWCTHHTLVDAGHVPVILISNQNPKTDGLGTGRYLVTLQTAMPQSGADMTITLSSTCPSSGFPACQPGDPVSAAADQWLMPLAVNDLLFFANGNEALRVKSITSPTSILVERGYFDLGGGAVDHPAHGIGEQLRTHCNAQVFKPTTIGQHQATSTTEMNWAFLQSPDASNPNYYAVRGLGGSHTTHRPPYWTADIFQTNIGEITDPATWAQGNQYVALFNPTFAGKMAQESPDRFETHPSYMNGFAPGVEAQWVADAHPFIGLITQTAVLISGTLYKVTNVEAGLFPRHFDWFPVAGTKILTDVSGPASSIGTTTADNWNFCYALIANECRSGSTAGDVYANVPGLVTIGCGTTADLHDLCMNNKGMRSLSVEQARIVTGLADTAAVTTQRVLTRLYTDPRIWPNTANVKALPDGSWIIYTPATPPFAVILKVPPQPTADGKDRTGFLAAPLAVTPPGGQTATVDFGYFENGSSTDFYCTTRRERCQTDATTLDQANPFKWVTTETVTGATCSPTCSIKVPALPGRVVYYRVHYRSGGTEVGVGPSGVILDGTPVKSR